VAGDFLRVRPGRLLGEVGVTRFRAAHLVEQRRTVAYRAADAALHGQAVEDPEAGSAAARQRMEDVAYTLCVSTGARDLDAALAIARRQAPPPTQALQGPSQPLSDGAAL
jgi:hypothetical protein